MIAWKKRLVVLAFTFFINFLSDLYLFLFWYSSVVDENEKVRVKTRYRNCVSRFFHFAFGRCGRSKYKANKFQLKLVSAFLVCHKNLVSWKKENEFCIVLILRRQSESFWKCRLQEQTNHQYIQQPTNQHTWVVKVPFLPFHVFKESR